MSKSKNKTKKQDNKRVIVLLIILIIVASGAFMYKTYTSLKAEKVSLENKNISLENTRLSLIGGDEEDGEDSKNSDVISEIDNKSDQLQAIYNKVPNDLTSSVEFESMFLGWLNGTNVNIKTFASTDMILEKAIPVPNAAQTQAVGKSDLNSIANDIDRLDGIVIEETEITNESPAETTPEDLDNIPNLYTSTYTYNLELSMLEYMELLDKLYLTNEFHRLESAVFSSDATGKGSSILTIKSFAYDKPERYKNNEN